MIDDPERQTGEAGRSTLVPPWVLGATNLFAINAGDTAVPRLAESGRRS